MADIVNAIDLLLQSTDPRLLPILGPGNVTVPTTNIIGLPDYYSSALRVVLRATTQAFKTFTVGGTTPSSVVLTADLKNITGTVTWTLVSGAVTYTTSTNMLTIAAGAMTSSSAVFRASVTFNSVTYTDDITIISATEGGAVLGYLSNETAIVPTFTDATVLSYTDAGGIFQVYNGTVLVTGNAVTYSVVSVSGMNIGIDTTGTYTISNLTASAGSATIRAVYNGTTIDKTYSVIKQKISGLDGAQGVDGARGNVNLSRGITGSSWLDSEANLAISSQGFGLPRERDVVTLFNNSTSYSESKVYTVASGWIALTAYINGNLLVTGTVLAAAIATDAITAGKIQAGAITAGKIAAGSITADRMNVTQLSAITATIGTLRTATSGGRTEISDNVIKVFDETGTKRVQIGNLSL